MGELISVFELGVSEAYVILTNDLGVDAASLPPLDAIENEDWGRELVLSRFLEFLPESLTAVGVRLPDPEGNPNHEPLALRGPVDP